MADRMDSSLEYAFFPIPLLTPKKRRMNDRKGETQTSSTLGNPTLLLPRQSSLLPVPRSPKAHKSYIIPPDSRTHSPLPSAALTEVLTGRPNQPHPHGTSHLASILPSMASRSRGQRRVMCDQKVYDAPCETAAFCDGNVLARPRCAG